MWQGGLCRALSMTIYSATDGPMVRGNQLRGDELFGGSTVSQTCHSCVLHELESHWRKNQRGWGGGGGAIAPPPPPPLIRLGGRAPLIFRLLYKPGGGAHTLRFALFFFICCHNQG